jgi:hypothetical protein
MDSMPLLLKRRMGRRRDRVPLLNLGPAKCRQSQGRLSPDPASHPAGTEHEGSRAHLSFCSCESSCGGGCSHRRLDSSSRSRIKGVLGRDCAASFEAGSLQAFLDCVLDCTGKPCFPRCPNPTCQAVALEPEDEPGPAATGAVVWRREGESTTRRGVDWGRIT